MDSPQFERTRFLAQLDEMLRTDRQGAIDDMLQVLRERRVLITAHSAQDYDRRYLPDEGFTDHVKRSVSARLAEHLFQSGAISFSEKRNDPMTNRMNASVEVLSSTQGTERP